MRKRISYLVTGRTQYSSVDTKVYTEKAAAEEAVRLAALGYETSITKIEEQVNDKERSNS